MITSNFIHWTAAFIDGEGNFMQVGGWNSHSGQLVITVAQKDPELLERLLGAFGGKIYGPSRMRVLHWKLTGVRAVGLAMMIYPIMSQKRKREIRRVLAIWKTVKAKKKWGDYNTTCSRGHLRTPENTYQWRGATQPNPRCRMCMAINAKAAGQRKRLRLAAGL